MPVHTMVPLHSSILVRTIGSATEHPVAKSQEMFEPSYSTCKLGEFSKVGMRQEIERIACWDKSRSIQSVRVIRNRKALLEAEYQERVRRFAYEKEELRIDRQFDVQLENGGTARSR